MATVMRAVAQTDAAIIERSWHEPERFAAVFDRYYPEIHGFASRRLGGSLADDVAAETFLIAFDRRSQLVKEDVGFERAKGIGPVGHAKGTVWLFERLVTAIVDKPGQLP